ncbi:hypothetical protein, partial [Enterobacter cloacae complex sp. 2DZ2F20B]|uniref:hypothetical protein n=1 Tax=Enterobacter cloacae complex sp. 2DZ2F20B TaxID=2511993 RepID=UPI001025AC02
VEVLNNSDFGFVPKVIICSGLLFGNALVKNRDGYAYLYEQFHVRRISHLSEMFVILFIDSFW